MMITLILGGVKSGKSDHALDLFQSAPGPGLFIPTGKALDLAFRAQITDHRRGRAPSIPVRETGQDLPGALGEATKGFASILVDSLDFWLFSVMEAGTADQAARDLESALRSWSGGELFIVSSETGLGPMPATAQGLEFVQRLGRLNRMAASLAGEVHFVTAGIPMVIKSVRTGDGKETKD